MHSSQFGKAVAGIVATLSLSTTVLRAQAVDPLSTDTQIVTPSAIDSNLFTMYTPEAFFGKQYLSAIVCGTTGISTGCYGGGLIGPIKKIGAAMEGRPTVVQNTVTRDIYILELRGGDNRGEVQLLIYKEVQIIGGGRDTVSIYLAATIALPQLVGGIESSAFMAANYGYLMMGTNKGSNAVIMDKRHHELTVWDDYPLSVSSITADASNFISVIWGQGEFYSENRTLSPYGTYTQGGGGQEILLNTTNATSLPGYLD